MAIDGFWVETGDGLLVDAKAFGDADAEVVQHHVGPADQPLDDLASLGARTSRARLRLPRWQAATA